MTELDVAVQESLSYEELLVAYQKLQRRLNKIIKRSDTQAQRLYLLNKELEEMAYLDYMTKLYNRRYFFDKAKEYIQQAKQKNLPICIAILDIDNFKNINDLYGHDIGDQVIVDISSIIKTYSGQNSLSARYGGEEFIILFYNQTLEESKIICNNLLERIRNSVVRHVIKYTVSIGLSTKSNKTDTLDRLIKQADIALYKAKNSGKNHLEY